MKLSRLRITGFKSFIEPADVLIEPGLTGIVGPNGCGKSNLVEALRWVMGESSYKNMRASGMDDVIFAGSLHRPSRNMAEVQLTLDNTGRTAPAQFNQDDILEVSRRIEREAGSTYRVNGREVRAKDVQLLFADAATGARSAAMVRQGQISEIISAKPVARRRILEDAAGVAGLHVRRHEAELRLKAAEDNLVRVEDVLQEITRRIEDLRRQSRQAERYRALSHNIRDCETQLLLITYHLAEEALQKADAAMKQHDQAVYDKAQVQAEAAKAQAVAAYELPALRDKESESAARFQRINAARGALEAEMRRNSDRLQDITKRLGEIDRDMTREKTLMQDASVTIQRLEAEWKTLEAANASYLTQQEQLEDRVQNARKALNVAEQVFDAVQGRIALKQVQLQALEKQVKERQARLDQLQHDHDKAKCTLEQAQDHLSDSNQLHVLQDQIKEAATQVEASEQAIINVRNHLEQHRQEETICRKTVHSFEHIWQNHQTELRTLEKLFLNAPHKQQNWPKVLNSIKVQKGYEIALGAALGDDLDASLDTSAPAYWHVLKPNIESSDWPSGTLTLADVVEAPDALHSRLQQIAVVETPDDASRYKLKTGQRCVSVSGSLWRWDGLVRHDAQISVQARLLQEKNRMDELRLLSDQAKQNLDTHRATYDTIKIKLNECIKSEQQAQENAKKARLLLQQLSNSCQQFERRLLEEQTKRQAHQHHFERIAAELADAKDKHETAFQSLQTSQMPEDEEDNVSQARHQLQNARQDTLTHESALHNLQREHMHSTQRLQVITKEAALWADRSLRSSENVQELLKREHDVKTEQEKLQEAPALFHQRRRALEEEKEQAETHRKACSDALVVAQTRQRQIDQQAKIALEELGAAREQRAAHHVRRDFLRTRRDEAVQAIQDALNMPPFQAMQSFAFNIAHSNVSLIEAKCQELKLSRERLGAVNLCAAEELQEATDKHDHLARERNDLQDAIKQLRQAVYNLNCEGRERLIKAFKQVDSHFRELFTELFGGGIAELRLIDSEDPLEAGLDIFARPPGKKPQTMLLLSGGEQALTAIALIFAVFLTNPSPICVLDEVDAPLDDANVERYCNLLKVMTQKTDTRFLVITHNPITMARMNRLYGVTMAERGVSRLVSVALDEAEALREAV